MNATNKSKVKRDSRKRPGIKIHITDYSSCYYCKFPGITEQAIYCPACNFPMRGTEQEQRNFIISKRREKSQLTDINRSFNVVRAVLLTISILNLLSMLFTFVSYGYIGLFAGLLELVIGASFLAFFILAKQHPTKCLLFAIVLYPIHTILTGYLLYKSEHFGYMILSSVFRLFMVGVLFFGLQVARKWEDLRIKNRFTNPENL